MTVRSDPDAKTVERGFLDRVLDVKGEIDRRAVEVYVKQIQSEQSLLKALLEGMAQGALLVGSNGTIRYGNSAFWRLLGVAAPTWRETPADRILSDTPVGSIFEEARQGNVRITGREVRLTRPVERVLMVSAVPLHEGAIALFLLDISDRCEQEEQLRRTERAATLTQMTTILAHEIRNPLNSMSIHIQLLERALRRSGWEGDMEPLTVVRQEVMRLNELLEDFLVAARPCRPQMRSTDSRAVLTSALDLLQPEIHDHHVDVVIEEPSAWPEIVVDEGQLRRALINLIRNAVDAMPNGGTLTISVFVERSHITYRVRDTGHGMTPDVLERMFEPYYTTKSHGTGLGLVAVQRIVSEHAGTIKASSTPGVGTDVAIRIPMAPPTRQLLTSHPTPSTT